MREIVQRCESDVRKERETLDGTTTCAAFTMREKKQNGEQELSSFSKYSQRVCLGKPFVTVCEILSLRWENMKGFVEEKKIQQERVMRDYQRSLSNKSPASLPTISTALGISAEMTRKNAFEKEERRKIEEERSEQQDLVRIEMEKNRRSEAEDRVRGLGSVKTHVETSRLKLLKKHACLKMSMHTHGTLS